MDGNGGTGIMPDDVPVWDIKLDPQSFNLYGIPLGVE